MKEKTQHVTEKQESAAMITSTDCNKVGTLKTIKVNQTLYQILI